jgi:hypothetical protein
MTDIGLQLGEAEKLIGLEVDRRDGGTDVFLQTYVDRGVVWIRYQTRWPTIPDFLGSGHVRYDWVKRQMDGGHTDEQWRWGDWRHPHQHHETAG